MEMMMSKTNDTSSPALEDHRSLAESELELVTGGLVVNAIIMPLIALDISRPPPRKRCRDGGLEWPAKAEWILATGPSGERSVLGSRESVAPVHSAQRHSRRQLLRTLLSPPRVSAHSRAPRV